MEVYGKKKLQVKKTSRSVLLNSLAAMYLTCTMFWMHCFDFSKSYDDLSFQKVHLFKKIIKTAEKEPYKWIDVDDWFSFALHTGHEAF